MHLPPLDFALARMLLYARLKTTGENKMQRFKNNVSDGWLFKQELRFFRNFMRNWDRDVAATSSTSSPIRTIRPRMMPSR